MAIRNADLPPRLLRTQEAARFLGLSIRTLEKHRTYEQALALLDTFPESGGADAELLALGRKHA